LRASHRYHIELTLFMNPVLDMAFETARQMHVSPPFTPIAASVVDPVEGGRFLERDAGAMRECAL
jgi:hypothetical protein